MACAALLLTMSAARAQFADCSTGLLQMPTADMQADGTVMITNNYLNKNSLPQSGWNYDTFQYGIYVSFWNRVEIGYVCTIFNGKWDPRPNKTHRQEIMRNQDRHFVGRVALLREGDFGVAWLPGLVVGASDPLSGGGSEGGYLNPEHVSRKGNGFFNRYFAVISKHFTTPWGKLGAHAGYQYNLRKDFVINAPCVGVDWQPVWLQDQGILDHLDVIAEYDSRTVNLGLTASVWRNHFEVMFELQNFRWVNFGLRFKFRLKKCC